MTAGLFVGCAETADSSRPEKNRDLFLFNPYRNVDFSTTERFKADFHLHSTNSDGTLSPQENIRRFSELGFDFLPMVDHSYGAGLPAGRFHQRPAGHTILTSSQVGAGTNSRANAVTWPWSDFGVTEYYNIIPILASEPSRLHHFGSFFTEWHEEGAPGDWAAGQDVRSIYRMLECATVYDGGQGRFEIFHPERHVTEAAGSEDFADHLAWLDNTESNALHTAIWYQELLNSFPTVLSMEMFNQDDRHPSRHIYDRVMRGMMPARPVWLSANSDDHGGHSGRSVNIMLMQERTEIAFRQAWEQGAYFAKSFGAFDPGLLELDYEYLDELELPIHERINQRFGDRWAYLPTVHDIIIDDYSGYIVVKASNYTQFEWITEDGVVVADGNIVNFRTNSAISGYVRGQLTRRTADGTIMATTLMQPFGVGLFNPNSWFFHFTGLDVTTA